MIRNSDPDKAFGHDLISTRMLKICGNSICKSLESSFNSSYKVSMHSPFEELAQVLQK